MKRVGQFIILFIVCVILVYAYAVVFPQAEPSSSPNEEQTDVTVAHSSFPHGELKAEGLATYIGKPVEELTKIYGEPIEIQESAFGYDWWILGEDERDYLQISVKNNKVASIFVLGEEIETGPFKLGMDLTDISELITIYSNFDFTKNDVAYQLELTEEDMNYRPLVAFDNNSFAILHLDQGTGKLIGIRYLNKATLVRLMPYQLHQGELTDKVIDDSIDWQLINEDSQRQLQSILTILRKRDKYPTYVYSKELTESTERALALFIEKPEKVLTDKSQRTDWENHERNYQFNRSFHLSTAEFSHLIKLDNLDSKSIHGILYTPSYDVPFLVMTWYSEVLSKSQFTHKEDKAVGISFYKDVVLFLFSETAVESSATSNTTSSTSNVPETIESEVKVE